MNLSEIVYMSVLLMSFITGLTFFLYFKRPTKLVLSYVAISFVNECLGYYSLYYSSDKKVLVFEHNLYVCTYFIILTLYFYSILKYRQKNLLLVLSVSVFFVLFFYSIQTINKTFHYRQFIVLSMSFVLYAIIYFKQLLDDEDRVIENPNFWFVTGILFFHGGYFFLSGFINYISTKDPILARKLFTINHLLNIIYYSLITYGFICQRRLAKLSL